MSGEQLLGNAIDRDIGGLLLVSPNDIIFCVTVATTIEVLINSLTTHIKFSWAAADVNYHIAGKFDKELSLAVRVETAKLKSTSIILYVRNA